MTPLSKPSCSKALTTAHQAALRKLHKYKQLADDQQAVFLPFSVETTGGMADDAEELINQLSVVCKDHLTLPSAQPFATPSARPLPSPFRGATPLPFIAASLVRCQEQRERQQHCSAALDHVLDVNQCAATR